MAAEIANALSDSTMRLFVAIPVPSVLQQALCAVQDEFRRQLHGAKIRWSPQEQMHLTLRFLGDVPEKDVISLAESIARACVGASALQLSAVGLGVFPHLRNPRVIWAGIQEDKGRLELLWKTVDEAVRSFSCEKAEGAFSAHITLGRIKFMKPQEAADLRKSMDAMRSDIFGHWHAEKVCLLQSRLCMEGAVHSVVREFPLS